MSTDIVRVDSFGEVLKEGILETMPEVLEFGLDSILEDGLLKDAPFFGPIINSGKIVIGVMDRFFLNKAIIFINEFRKGNIDIAYKSTIMNNPKKYKDFIEHLLIYLDRYTEQEKVKFLNKGAYSCLDERINFDLFLDFMDILDRLFISDIKNIKKIIGKKEEVWLYGRERLQSLGLIEMAADSYAKLLVGAENARTGQQISLLAEFNYQNRMKELERKLEYKDFKLTFYGEIFYKNVIF